jgi:hypothetical protein
MQRLHINRGRIEPLPLTPKSPHTPQNGEDLRFPPVAFRYFGSSPFSLSLFVFIVSLTTSTMKLSIKTVKNTAFEIDVTEDATVRGA